MRCIMTFKPWDIVLIPFPITDVNATKRRPAVVISSDSYHSGQEVVLMYVTSNVKSDRKIGDHLISNWQAAGLPKPAICRMKFATIDKSLIIKSIGQLQKADVNTIKSKMKSFFHL